MSAEQALASTPAVEPYRDQFEYFDDELEKLDCLLALRTLEAKPAPARDELDQSVAAIERLQGAIDQRVESSRLAGRLPPLAWLRRRMGMSPFEQQSVLVCLAPELDLKYAAAYGELQRGGHSGTPTVGLVLDLLCRSPADRWRARPLLEIGASLLRWRFLERQPEVTGSGLADPIRLDPGLLRFLSGTALPDPRLADSATLELGARPSDRGTDAGEQSADEPRHSVFTDLARLMSGYERSGRQQDRVLVCHLASEGRGGVVENIRRICRDLGRPLLRLDAGVLDRREPEWELLLTLALRDSFLWQAPLLLQGLDTLPVERGTLLATRLLHAAERFGWLLLLDGGPAVPAARRGRSILWRTIEIPASDHGARERRWRRALAPFAGADTESWSKELAVRFRFEPEQIEETADVIEIETLGRDVPTTLDDCFRVCRAQAAPRLGEIGRIFTPRYEWTDLVLPASKRAQLDAICQSVRHHQAVFGGWGFGEAIRHGRAVSALLVGPSGTGKTMAVEIIAGALGLDVCKVDLSGVVSKYIGETEQRLAIAFREAWAANAVLFFDEADALFGKRTEISDARDRYANIETSYLLQKIEEYEGIVVLASNLRDNMDEAFTRRLRFIVEFPSPNEAARLDIWKRHIPAAAPLDADVDLPLLAKRFAVSGGSIRNIVVRGALLATEHGTAIRMDDLIAAGREEFEKIGKSWVS